MRSFWNVETGCHLLVTFGETWWSAKYVAYNSAAVHLTSRQDILETVQVSIWEKITGGRLQQVMQMESAFASTKVNILPANS